MDTDYLGHGRSQQAHRIIITQIRLGRKRQLHNIVYRTDIIRKQIHFLHLSPVERRVMIYQIHQLVQPFPLQVTQFLTTHALFILVPNHVFHFV